MRSHVNSVCSKAHFYLRNISKIRHLLDRRTTADMPSVLILAVGCTLVHRVGDWSIDTQCQAISCILFLER